MGGGGGVSGLASWGLVWQILLNPPTSPMALFTVCTQHCKLQPTTASVSCLLFTCSFPKEGSREHSSFLRTF